MTAVVRIFSIGVAGFIGTLLRYWLSGVIARRYGETFPYGTLAVNLLGCFVIGFLFFLFYDRALASPTSRTTIFILHTTKILRLSEDLPMVVEIVDSLEKVEAFLPVLDGLIADGLVTLEKVKVLHYKASR